MSQSLTDQKKLKNLLMNSISHQLEGLAFKAKLSRDSVVRQLDDIRHIYQFAFIESSVGWRIQPGVAVRFDHVEDIFHQTSGFDPKYQKDTPTIGGFIGSIRFASHQDCEFSLENVEQVAQVADALVELFHGFAEPYFERFTSLAAVDTELNDKPTERTPNRVAPWLRCATGSIVARLVDRPNYGDLIQVYLDTMRTSDKGFYLKRYQALLDWLDREYR